MESYVKVNEQANGHFPHVNCIAGDVMELDLPSNRYVRDLKLRFLTIVKSALSDFLDYYKKSFFFTVALTWSSPTGFSCTLATRN
jgi:hypothetical protein